MKKASASAGRKPSTSKQKGKAKAIKPDSKRKSQALKASQDARIREKEQNKSKTIKRALTKARSGPSGSDGRNKVPLSTEKLSTNGSGKSTIRTIDDKAWAAELEQSVEPEYVNRAGQIPSDGSPVFKHDPIENSAKKNPAKETSFIWPLPMEIALVQWRFCANSMVHFQQACVRLASNAAAWPKARQ